VREWVIRKELALAHELEKRIVPIKVDDAVDRREEAWRLAPGSHISDFRSWQKLAAFKEQVDLMLEALRRKRPSLLPGPATRSPDCRRRDLVAAAGAEVESC
jgi:hypothetical protein